jgi:hypothetical protein
MPALLIAVRYVLPAVVVVAGLVLFAFGPAEGAAAIVGAGLSVWLLNELYRLGVRGDQERAAEDAARAYFDRYGHWPDEDDDST